MPEALSPTREGAFVIHLHDATRRHYDLRLEAAGVLASFAVPRGPSLDPNEKRLAVRTEDHPLEYLEFEAVIPEKNYGAGAMIVWDRGKVRFLERDAEAGLDDGKVDFELEGLKVRGRYALVKIKGETKEWLLLKKTDAYSSPGGERDPVRDLPRSVLSGLTVEELGSAASIGAAIEAAAAELGAPKRAVDARRLPPMLCTSDGAPEASGDWLYELKLDGVRVIASKEGDRATLVGRSLRETTATYPEVARAVQALAPSRVVLDGEIVAFDASGRPSFGRLSERIHLTKPRDIQRAAAERPVVFVAFDLLAIGERDLRDLPLSSRKELLHRLLPSAGLLRAIDHFDDSRPLMEFCAARDLEGAVAKLRASKYSVGPRRTGDWVKMKRRREGDFVVVGYTQGEGGRSSLGALELASYQGEELIHRGRVGSGLEDKSIAALLALLRPLIREDSPATGNVTPTTRPRVFTAPEVVVRIRYPGFTGEGLVRHAVFEGIRDDVDPRSCTVNPTPGPDDAPPTSGGPEAEPASETTEQPASSPRPSAAPPTADANDVSNLPAVTNRNKVLWPGEGITKAELCAYYAAIAPAMLPFLRDRPIMLVRYPDGILGKSFYQWNVPTGTPSWIRTHRMPDDKGDPVEVFLIGSARELVHVANLAAIPIHVLAARVSSLDEADFLTLDFDVKGASLAEGIVLARSLREILDEVGLPGFPKTSGQSGLHVFIPLGPGASFTTARALADLLGRLLVERHPTIATMERIVAKRGPKVYVDTGQTGPTRTIVAPWAVRAQPGATVSTPLEWDEVAPGLDPRAFSIKTVPARFRERGDPMAPMLAAVPDLPAALEALGALVQRSHAARARPKA